MIVNGCFGHALVLFLLFSLTNHSVLARKRSADKANKAEKPEPRQSPKSEALEWLNLQILDIELAFKNKMKFSDSEAAEKWHELGVMYQTKYLKYHEVGDSKHRVDAQAFRAYDKALSLDGQNAALICQVSLSKSILQKETGRGQEALDTLQLASPHVVTSHDKSALEATRADVYVMLGQIDAAATSYEEALVLAPYQVNLYLPLTMVYKELERYNTPEEWLKHLNTIEAAIDKWQDKTKWSRSTVGDIKRSFLRSESDDPLKETSTISSNVYWAMYNAADAAKEYRKAWRFLGLAHNIDAELLGREGKIASSFKEHEKVIRGETKSIKTLFNHGFWIEGLGHESKVPVFIVGMLRSGSTLLETMLNMHDDVVGLGEHSFFASHQSTFGSELIYGRGEQGEIEDIFDDMQDVVEKHGKIVLDHIQASAALTKTTDRRDKKVLKIVDKMLFNYKSIGMIHTMFPHAVILHIMRDPLDTILSCYTHKFEDTGATWTTHSDRVALEYAVYLEVMQHYREMLPNRVIDVLYEELVASPEAVMRMITHALDLPWQRKVRHGIYNRSVGGWRRYADHLEPLKKAYLTHFPRLKELKALPYEERINWEGLVKFDYDGMLQAVVNGDHGLISGNQLQHRKQQPQDGFPQNVEIGMDGNVLPIPPVTQNFNNNVNKKKTKKTKKKKTKTTQGKA